MGYALFTCRKLMLQKRLNQVNYRQLAYQQKRNELVNQAANIEMKLAARDMKYQQDMLAKQTEIFGDLTAGGGNSQISDDQMRLYETTMAQMETKYKSDTSIENMTLKSLSAQENVIDLEIKKLDTQVKEITTEMEGVEKAEENGIKNSTPKYGG